MLKKLLLGSCLLLLVLLVGLFLWARAVFTQDGVRAALAQQLSKTLGQPVTVGGVAASIFPRVTLNLERVSIGEPSRIRIETLHVGTDLRALLSRRIEHATLQLAGAHLELPLPAFALGSSSAADSSATESRMPVEIVSIDEIVLRDVEVVSGGRTLKGNIDVVPAGNGLTVRDVTLGADQTMVKVTGQITDLSGPVGELTLAAGSLSFDQLLAFANDFSAGAGLGGGSGTNATRTSAPGARPMDLAVSLQADRATMGALALDKLAGKARITADRMTLMPIGFGLFGGRYSGSLAFALGAAPDFTLSADLSGIDVAAATAFAGSPNTITGRMSGMLKLTGRGLDAPTVMKAARGTARVDLVDGAVKKLGLVRTVVIATSGRADAGGAVTGGGADEPFTKLGATLTIADGSARTEDLRFESKDLVLTAAGTVRLDGSAINLAGKVQLSDDLSRQAGRDLVRYTQEGGRVTLPATITGSAAAPQVRIDVAEVAKRALTNRATEEAQKALKKGLGGLFKR